MLSRGVPISDLKKVMANDLMDHDLVVLSHSRFERDEDGETILSRTVTIELGELKRFKMTLLANARAALEESLRRKV